MPDNREEMMSALRSANCRSVEPLSQIDSESNFDCFPTRTSNLI